jgi:putative membrane protein
MAHSFVVYLHYLSIFLLFALLSIEHVQFKLPLDISRARRLIITDLAYGVCAGLVLFSGLARVLWYGKGLDYYLGNSLFHAKIGLFIVIGLISVVPTFVFLNWRNSLQAGEVPQVSARQARLVTGVIRLELLLLLIIPLLAVLMARGHGVID